MISLRAADQNAALRRHARALGFVLLALPGLRLLPIDDVAARDALLRALQCPQCVFTSPAAVRHALRLASLAAYGGQAYAVGGGTAAALRRAGVADVASPVRQMHSEGLLDLPGLRPPAADVGLVTAPGGRGLIESALQARGARVHVAHVYRRVPAALSARSRAALRASRPAAVLVSSLEALDSVLAQLDAAEAALVRGARPIAASARLAAALRDRGFGEAAVAGSARPAALVAALVAHANGGGIR